MYKHLYTVLAYIDIIVYLTCGISVYHCISVQSTGSTLVSIGNSPCDPLSLCVRVCVSGKSTSVTSDKSVPQQCHLWPVIAALSPLASNTDCENGLNLDSLKLKIV